MTIGLVDANNFYVSCERAFNPRLKKSPVIVLSNNDGCVISRSQEAKDMGIKMGDPWFKIQQWALSKGVHAFSSNYPLYGDMSRRIFEVLKEFSPLVEPYSIDEMFIDLTGIDNIADQAQEIRARILQKTKIPTCIGIGETKTKAKLGNHLAKITDDLYGICDLQNRNTCERFYSVSPIECVWGIGRQSARKLSTLGFQSIHQLIQIDDKLARKLLTITGARIVMELRGISCFPLSTATSSKKAIMVSRTFGNAVSDLRTLCSAISTFVPIVAEKLRQQKLEARALTVFASTNRFAAEGGQESSITFEIPPTSDPFLLNREVLHGVRKMWVDGMKYTRAGISVHEVQSSTENIISANQKSERFMQAFNSITQRYGRNSLRTAGMKLSAEKQAREVWDPRLDLSSPAYTTNINDLLQLQFGNEHSIKKARQKAWPK